MKTLRGKFVVELKGNGVVQYHMLGQTAEHLVLRGRFDEVAENLRSVTLTTIGDNDWAAFDSQLEEFYEKFFEANEYSFQFGGQPAEQWPILICQFIKE